MTRGNNFDALRLLGALAVLVSHQFAVMGLAQPRILGFNLGTVGVFMFFAMSGYLVAGSWQSDPDGFRFLARRFLRMFPGWFVLTLLSLAVYVGLGITHFPENPVVGFNGSLWTLEWEILCYLVLGVLALVSGLRVASVAALVALGSAWAAGLDTDGTRLGLMFAAGVAVQSFGAGRLVSVSCVALALIGALAGKPYLVLLATVPILSILAGLYSWPYLRRAGRFGDFSYGIYIYAFPVQQFGVMLLGVNRPYLLLLGLSIAVTGALAFLSWHLVEEPSLSLKHRLRPTSESGTEPLAGYKPRYSGTAPS